MAWRGMGWGGGVGPAAAGERRAAVGARGAGSSWGATLSSCRNGALQPGSLVEACGGALLVADYVEVWQAELPRSRLLRGGGWRQVGS